MSRQNVLTTAGQAVFNEYFSTLSLEELFRTGILLCNFLSCKSSNDCHVPNNCLNEIIRRLARQRTSSRGSHISEAQKYLLSLCSYSLFHLDTSIQTQKDTILLLIREINFSPEKKGFAILQHNLLDLCRSLSPEWPVSLRNFEDSCAAETAMMENDYEEPPTFGDFSSYNDLIFVNDENDPIFDEEYYDV